MADKHEAIHGWFSLSYANYLVFPRSVLQSMPDEWQERFVALLEQVPPRLGTDWEPSGGYDVHAKNESGKYVSDPYSNYERGRRRLPVKED